MKKVKLLILFLLALSSSIPAFSSEVIEIEDNFWPLFRVMDKSLTNKDLINKFNTLYYGEYVDRLNEIFKKNADNDFVAELKILNLQAKFYPRFLEICNQDASCREAWQQEQMAESPIPPLKPVNPVTPIIPSTPVIPENSAWLPPPVRSGDSFTHRELIRRRNQCLREVGGNSDEAAACRSWFEAAMKTLNL